MKRIFVAFCLSFVLGLSGLVVYNVIGSPNIHMDKNTQNKLENTLYLELKNGVVVIELYPQQAPKHVARIKELCRQKFYDGLKFHRVIEGFMAQGGDPKGNGMGGSGTKIPAEFNKLPHLRGAVSMARSSDPDSADSQFFIVLADSRFLDGQYTVWGNVVKGMELVDEIKKGISSRNGEVVNPDRIVTMRVAIDVEKENLVKK